MPRAEAELSAAGACGGGSDQRCLDVRIGVALRMAISGVLSDELSQLGLETAGNIWVGGATFPVPAYAMVDESGGYG